MGADPIGALPVGQGNAATAKAMCPNPSLEREAMDWPSIFILPLHVATVELEWAPLVLVQVRVILPASRRRSEPKRQYPSWRRGDIRTCESCWLG